MATKKLTSGEWSKAEVGILKKMFPVTSTPKVAAKLSRSPESVDNEGKKDETQEIGEVSQIHRQSLTARLRGGLKHKKEAGTNTCLCCFYPTCIIASIIEFGVDLGYRLAAMTDVHAEQDMQKAMEAIVSSNATYRLIQKSLQTP